MRDYMIQKTPYEEQIKEAARMITGAENILIGAGAGLSAAAGLTYGGKRFEENFPEFIEKYGMTDMYSAGFYPFPSEEARWGYWSKHSYMNRISPPALPLYQSFYDLMKEKNYFVLTTNVDAQFEKAGFARDRIFATQGDYGKIQCARGCHQKVYDAVLLFKEMNEAREDCQIPSELVPKCPVCGGPMTMHLRCDQHFVEDEKWHEAANRYGSGYEEPTGAAMVTPGFNLPCRYVIHTVGPIVPWKLNEHLREDLKNCYRSCLEAALENGIRSIAFCCISTGEFHFPNDEAAEIAVEIISEFLKTHDDKFDRIIFNVFKDLDKELYKKRLK